MKAIISTLTPFKIYFYDVDPMQVVWHGNYPRFFEVARSALMDKIDYNYPQMQTSGFMWPIVDMRIRYVRPLLLNQEIVVEAGLIEYENRLVINYKIYDSATNQLLTKASTTQVAVKQGSTSMELESPAVLVEKVKGICQ
jgi:acyl-CoA thioester hydrolase